MKKVICNRCGESVFQRRLRLENFYKVNTSSKEAYIKSLIDLEGATKEEATSWAEHGLFEQCKEKKRNCPECNSELRTWRAKMCLSCGAKFEPWLLNENT